MKSNSSVESFGDRINLIIDSLGGPGKAAEKIGTNYTTLKRWKSDEAEPSLSTLVKIAEVAEVSLDWLMKGLTDAAVSENKAIYEIDKNLPDDEYAYIPAYDVEVSAGNGAVCLGEATATKHLAFRRQWLTARGLREQSLAALFTKGDSMTPTIPESAVVVINREHTQALDGKVYVIRIDDRHFVKRTQWLIGGGLRLISDNKFYEPLDITKADMEANNIEICGQVIHTSYDLPD